LGNGGPKNTRTYNEDKNLNNKVKLLQKISKLIDENIKSKDVQIDENGAIYCNDEIIDDYEDD
jgi:hypothetical protein